MISVSLQKAQRMRVLCGDADSGLGERSCRACPTIIGDLQFGHAILWPAVVCGAENRFPQELHETSILACCCAAIMSPKHVGLVGDRTPETRTPPVGTPFNDLFYGNSSRRRMRARAPSGSGEPHHARLAWERACRSAQRWRSSPVTRGSAPLDPWLPRISHGPIRAATVRERVAYLMWLLCEEKRRDTVWTPPTKVGATQQLRTTRSLTVAALIRCDALRSLVRNAGYTPRPRRGQSASATCSKTTRARV